jgi:Tfp pilus assembly protein PilF
MDYADRVKPALAWFRKGYALQRAGDLQGAVAAYQRSIALYPTAEGHTFLGWAYSFEGRIGEAIAECEKAIAVDPDFGNPYNDIGVYLIQLGKEAQAIPWLKKAMEAPRYECRCYPHFNLAGILERKGQLQDALVQYRKALDLEPSYAQARLAIARIVTRLNESSGSA